MLYQNDQWDVSDHLGMEGAGDGLAKMILQVTPPFTIAVAGKWGSGKTSLMQRSFVTLGGDPISKAVPLGNMRQNRDERAYDESLSAHKADRQRKLGWEPDICEVIKSSLCVWYSPWQHQNADNPVLPLLLEIKQQFIQRANKISDGFKDKARKSFLAGLTLLERVADGALMITGKIDQPFLTGTTESIRNIWNGNNAGLNELSDGQRFHLQFEDAIETVLQSLSNSASTQLPPNARLVIFIDDLDRCEEAVVIQLLEAIKLYLGTSRCVFVLGLDHIAVLEALRSHWPTRSEDHNREYLEKLFQATIRVPAPRLPSAQRMIEAQLQAHQIPNPPKWAELLVELIEPNPRKLKNFTNSLCASWSLHRIKASADRDDNVKRLILFQYLSLYHPAVWRILERQPWALQILRGVLLGNTQEMPRLRAGYAKADQRMMEYYFSRSFSHILRHTSTEPSKEDKHRGLDMETAVELFLERIDRKRSDEVFARLAQDTFTHEDEVEECYLCIAAPDSEEVNV